MTMGLQPKPAAGKLRLQAVMEVEGVLWKGAFCVYFLCPTSRITCLSGVKLVDAATGGKPGKGPCPHRWSWHQPRLDQEEGGVPAVGSEFGSKGVTPKGSHAQREPTENEAALQSVSLVGGLVRGLVGENRRGDRRLWLWRCPLGA